MKRIVALIIDTMIVHAVSFAIIIFLELVHVKIYQAYLFIVICNAIYLFVFDYYNRGITIGKWITQTNVIFLDEKPSYLKFAFGHIICRTLITYFTVLGFCIYFSNHKKMPYEKWLNVRIS